MRDVAAVLAGGLIGGLVAGVVAGVWGRTPAGNTALMVPFSVGPAIVAAGWAWLAVASGTGDRGRLLVSAAAYAAAALVLALVTMLLPLATVATNVPPLAGLIALAIPLVLAAPVGIALAARLDRPRPGRGWGAMPLVVALLVLLVMSPTGLAYVVAPLLIAVVLVAPLAPDVDRTGAMAERIAGSVLLPIVVTLGLYFGAIAIG